MNVSLEPETDCGKSDIYFEYEGVPYLVECYCPSFLTGGQDTSSHLIKAAGAISDVIRESKKPLRVCLRLKKSISAEEDKRVGYFAAKVICEMGSGAILIREDDVIKIDIHDISGMSVDTDFPKLGGPFKFFEGASWGLKILSVPEHRIDEVRLGKSPVMPVGRLSGFWRMET